MLFISRLTGLPAATAAALLLQLELAVHAGAAGAGDVAGAEAGTKHSAAAESHAARANSCLYCSCFLLEGLLWAHAAAGASNCFQLCALLWLPEPGVAMCLAMLDCSCRARHVYTDMVVLQNAASAGWAHVGVSHAGCC